MMASLTHRAALVAAMALAAPMVLAALVALALAALAATLMVRWARRLLQMTASQGCSSELVGCSSELAGCSSELALLCTSDSPTPPRSAT